MVEEGCLNANNIRRFKDFEHPHENQLREQTEEATLIFKNKVIASKGIGYEASEKNKKLNSVEPKPWWR